MNKLSAGLLTSVVILTSGISNAFDEWKDDSGRQHYRIYQEDVSFTTHNSLIRFYWRRGDEINPINSTVHIGENLDVDSGATIPENTHIEGEGKTITHRGSSLMTLTEGNVVKDLNFVAGQYFMPTISINAEQATNYVIDNCTFNGSDNLNSCGISTSNENVTLNKDTGRRQIARNLFRNFGYGIQSLNSADEIYENTFSDNVVSVRQRTIPLSKSTKDLEGVVNLGTIENAGNNTFERSKDYDIINLSQTPIPAYGNKWDVEPKISGNVETGYSPPEVIKNPCPMSVVGLDKRSRKLRDYSMRNALTTKFSKVYHKKQWQK